MYGETTCIGRWRSRVLGLSPRVRGNQPRPLRERPAQGSIPACTGKPRSPAHRAATTWVYPRVYGETPTRSCLLSPCGGLSPRVRGNRTLHHPRDGVRGSIPACTGKPLLSRPCSNPIAVYPRVYGETLTALSGVLTDWGLSPRVRGNPDDQHDRHAGRGSIPACTGKPAVWAACLGR